MASYFPNKDRKVPLGRPARYPWNEWTDGKERLLREGQDFFSMAESFVLLCRRTARVRDLRVSVSTTKVPDNASPQSVMIEGEQQWLQPGGTYVIVKFTKEDNDVQEH